ncbi:MAG: hypothetical protein K1X65_04660 [Caldilineales bacterium]|nr:hypothetical protein [Caldilineales bacterium]
MSYDFQSDVRLDTDDVRSPRLVVSVPLDQAESVRDALTKLANSPATGASAQEVILSALRTAAEQAYFWTPEWQEKERATDLAVAEGRVQTFERMDEMIAFLDRQ